MTQDTRVYNEMCNLAGIIRQSLSAGERALAEAGRSAELVALHRAAGRAAAAAHSARRIILNTVYAVLPPVVSFRGVPPFFSVKTRKNPTRVGKYFR